MDKKTKDTLKTGLAAVGAFTVVTTAPVLAAGVAIGMLLTNPDKVKAAAEKVSEKLKDFNKEMEEAACEEESSEEEEEDYGLKEFFEEEDRREAEEEAAEVEVKAEVDDGYEDDWEE